MENKQSIAEAYRNLGVSRGMIESWLAAEANSHDAEKVRLRQLEEKTRRIRKEKADLEDTVEIPQKQRCHASVPIRAGTSRHLQSKPEKRCETIRKHSGERSAEKMCLILKASQSGYYRWLDCPDSATKQENRAINAVLKVSYAQNRGRAGLNELLDDVRLKFRIVAAFPMIASYASFPRKLWCGFPICILFCADGSCKLRTGSES